MSLGENRAEEAAREAIASPLLENFNIRDARRVIINFSSFSEMTLFEMQKTANLIANEVSEDADILFGKFNDESLGENLRIIIIAADFASVLHDNEV